MKVLPALLATSLFFSSGLYANDSAVIESLVNKDTVLTEDQQRLADTYKRMLRYYEQRNFSSTRSVRVLLSNYPHHVTPILYAAFERYPRHYRHIIKAAIDAEPAFTREIISIALNLQVADPADIVRIAVETEPSYAETAVSAVDEIQPSHLNDVIRVAVTTEPNTADGILRAHHQAETSKLISIIHTVLSAAPALGHYLTDTLSDIIGSNDPKSMTEAERDAQRKRAIQLLRSAYQNGGINADQLEAIAARHQLTETDLSDIRTEYWHSLSNRK